MPAIIQLDRHVADLIAAGEVVERPASAVKELVENAIDAGAKNITVEIQNGGMRFLRVTDDGCGMTPQDARTAFLRHATSKIRTKEDLAAIGTLGFRGEALAAISSVSRIDLLTRPADAETGTKLHLEAGVITDEQPAGCPCGTTILVRDLFFNTPARMKFMKSDIAEASAVTVVMQQQALAHPEIRFRLLKDGEEQLHSDGQNDRLAAIYTVFGRELAAGLVKVEGHWEKTTVSGYVTKPTTTRGNRSWQHFFVNGRFIKSRLLSAAVEEAYKNQIMAGRFPACVLDITLPVTDVDVNVHPAKTEVRFLSERAVFDAVHYAVLSTLNKAPGKPEMKLPTAPAVSAAPKPAVFQHMQAQQYRHLAGLDEKTSRRNDDYGKEFSVRSDVILPRASAPQKPPVEKAAPVQKVIPPEKPAEEKLPVAEVPSQQVMSLPQEPVRFVGEVLDTYLIAQQGETVYLIDKHAAHERILFEKLKQQNTPVMAQLLLRPVPAHLGSTEAACALEQQALLERCGFEIEDFGNGDVLMRQIPADLNESDAAALLQELAECLLEGRTLHPEDLHDELLHTMACKAAIKGGWQTGRVEQEKLAQEVLRREDLKYCPHGRPICITLTKKQLEKQFKRI